MSIQKKIMTKSPEEKSQFRAGRAREPFLLPLSTVRQENLSTSFQQSANAIQSKVYHNQTTVPLERSLLSK